MLQVFSFHSLIRLYHLFCHTPVTRGRPSVKRRVFAGIPADQTNDIRKYGSFQSFYRMIQTHPSEREVEIELEIVVASMDRFV
jgi:hypothetical protein